MKLAVAVLAVGFVLLAHPVRAAVTFEYIMDNAYPVAVSSDGSVITGTLNSGGFPSFRWTQATGPVSLARPQTGGGGGVPAISADGTRIAYAIGSLDNTYRTQGRWTLGSGWQELMPPIPPDGGIIDGSYGSTWGLSGDGQTVVGLYWRAGVGNRAHASKWTQAGGVVDLGGTTTGQASRANGVNFDGSVIAGWVETPVGPWRPAAWVGGSLVLLTNWSQTTNAGEGEAKAVSPSGDVIVGFSRDPVSNTRSATKWTRTGGVFGPPQILGIVPGTSTTGNNIPFGVSANGSVVVGYCTFNGDPFSTTGFIWTAQTGVQDINEFLGDNGVFVDPNFSIRSLTAITPDGTQIFGDGAMLTPPYTKKGFRITVPAQVAVPPGGGPEAPVAQLELSAPSPNPSSSATQLEFALPTGSHADLAIFDATGRRVATLLDADLPSGRRTVTWDGREASGSRAAAGLYFARLTTDQGMASRRLVRLR